ncbi:MAG: hypothetical protein GWQ05_22545 [Verrucomicrobiaceae bacterium]|nr:hypothetical protein [Verrucomicrobiaceae bacterium]NCF93711.1 hypothetical protein [Verrucomicrobiaceae bacterium]
MQARAVLPLLALGIIGCASIVSEPLRKSGLAAIQGRWIYSHLGGPSVWKDSVSDGEELIEGRLIECRIVIGGQTALVTPNGEGMNFTLQVEEETPLMMLLEATDGKETGWTYDKETDLLMMTMSLTVDGEKGKIPAYFKRG